MIELPKDSEGREIPLDTKRLYDADGVPVSIRAFRYNPHECFWRVERLDGLGTPKTTELRFITPDSWEKLLEDLKAVEDYGNSSHLDNPTCHYLKMAGKSCDKCKFYVKASCIGEMCADIAYRIRKLRGED